MEGWKDEVDDATDSTVGLREAAPASLFPIVAERTRCVPTWIARTGGCWVVIEKLNAAGVAAGAASTGMPCEANKLRPGDGIFCSRPSGDCSNTRGAIKRPSSSLSKLELLRVQVQEVEAVRNYQCHLVPMTSPDDQKDRRSRRYIQQKIPSSVVVLEVSRNTVLRVGV